MICRSFYITVSLLLFAAAIFPACSSFDSSQDSVLSVKASSDSIRYTGRTKEEGDSVSVYWPGTSIMFRFNGRSVKALMRDETTLNYFNVVIDRKEPSYFKMAEGKQFYKLAHNLADGEHTIELIKRTEWDKGMTWFYGLQIERGELLELPEKNKRTIEFFGNSITAGYAIENYSGEDSPDSIFTNNYHTYAAITARHFEADYYCTVKSGIGIMISWFPLIMPEMYDRLDPRDSMSKWDFKKVTPDIVVINLFQNDSWLIKMPEYPTFISRFGSRPPEQKEIIQAYRSFVEKIRSVYPSAHIICALGNMDATKPGSPWPSYVTEAVWQLQDPKIHTLFFPYMNKGGHPRKEDNEKMARSLIAFIEKNIGW